MESERTMITISDMELRQLFSDAFWMENHLEFFNEFIGSLHVKKQIYKDTIEKIGKDSKKHKEMLDGIIQKIETIDLEQIHRYQGSTETDMKFEEMNEDQIMETIYKNEKMIYSYYQKIYNTVNRERLKDVWTGDDVEEFFQVIKGLMNWELTHIELVEQVLKQKN